MASKKHVIIYTDGACTGNPGPGGYGVVLIYGEHRHELSGGYRRTTNNRMELMGPIRGLETLNQSCRVTLHSDSQYVVEGIEKGWAKRWRSNGWMRNKREKAVNPDLWGKLLDLCDIHEVEFRWVRGQRCSYHCPIPRDMPSVTLAKRGWSSAEWNAKPTTSPWTSLTATGAM